MFDKSKKHFPKNFDKIGSVHAELLLSDLLNERMEVIRQEVNTLSESLEKEISEK